MRFLHYLHQIGYKPFRGAVKGDIYRFFDCPHPEKGRWYVNDERTSFQCVGCSLYCETDDWTDFQLFLPLESDVRG
ncbi:MAG: DNA-binding protein [Desulfohalobiaceae bacterium]|nr:DNA-binding protein [Desulfohalobiaceae bacterium]